jgi:hypothetical protein
MYTSLLQRERRGEERVQAMCSMSEGTSQCMWTAQQDIGLCPLGGTCEGARVRGGGE